LLLRELGQLVLVNKSILVRVRRSEEALHAIGQLRLAQFSVSVLVEGHHSRHQFCGAGSGLAALAERGEELVTR
jgi:hypothetical protein